MKIFLRGCLVIMIQLAVSYFVTSKVFADEIDAQELFKKHCVICHGEDGKGKTDLGEGLGARDFTNKEFQSSITDEAIIKQITNGSEGTMFPFKDKLTHEEMVALIPVIRAFGKE
ncbi:MAG: c-type cytochrome [Candidatus Scalindua sp.]|nr:c-type cytochrome [Candidatus Scalindua sp.]